MSDDVEPALVPAERVLEPAALTARKTGKGPLRRLGEILKKGLCRVDADMSRFDASWFGSAKMDKKGKNPLPQFRAILDRHNKDLPRIAAIRKAILDAARAELAALRATQPTTQPASQPTSPPAAPTTNVLTTVNELYVDAMSGEPGAGTYDAAQWLALIEADRGSPTAFDPWNSWWAGEYTNPKKFYNLHIWDPSLQLKPLGYDQYVQPVTQVSASKQWFASARRLEEEHTEAKKVDYALNVWSVTDGVTGYVQKDLATSPQNVPHAGFLVETNVLVWCALFEPVGLDDKEKRVLMMFVETGFPTPAATGHYTIRGALTQACWSGTTLVITDKFGQINTHRGDYHCALRVRDRASMDCAIKNKALGGMDPKVQDEIVKKTRK